MRILVPVDGSDLSFHAVDYVARALEKGEVVLLHVTGIPPSLLEHRGGSTEEEERELEHSVAERSLRYEKEIMPEMEREIFRPAEERLQRARSGRRFEVRRKLVTQPTLQPAVAIIDEAHAEDYDAVVVGRHRRSGITRFFIGGTASKVVHHLQRTAVWVVP
jgi:nucleotide-binding universal stress UspA family protein